MIGSFPAIRNSAGVSVKGIVPPQGNSTDRCTLFPITLAR